MASTPKKLPLIFLALLVAGVGGVRAWFAIGPDDEHDGIWLTWTNRVPGYTFHPDPLNEKEISMLHTDDYIQGTFIDNEDGTEIPVFAANWVDLEGRGLTVVQHTPDICWVQAGWIPEPTPQRNISIPIRVRHEDGSESTVELPFEQRIFTSPDGFQRQLTLWTTLIGGQVFTEYPARENQIELPGFLNHGQIRGPITRTKLAMERFAQAVTGKFQARGRKQFVRFSVALGNAGESQISATEIAAFATKWLNRIVTK